MHCLCYLQASPVHEVEGRSVQRSILGTFAEWLHKVDGVLDTALDRVKQPFEKIYSIVIGAGEGVVGYGVEKLENVLTAYYDIKSKSEENLNKIKNTFLARVITQLQTIVETLTQQADAETIEQLKQKIKDISQSSKESLEKLQQQLQEAINAEKDKLESSLSKWETEANGVIKQKRF